MGVLDMPLISYAQNCEDVMLWRALKHVQHGFYVDVGANEPVINSVTHLFYERGWSGINLEPLAKHIEELNTARPRDANIQCAAGSNTDETNKLAQVFKKHQPQEIHFLKINAAGFEKEVVLGNDWRKFRPWILVIAGLLPNSQIENHADWESVVLQHDYDFAYADGLNRFYVAREHLDLKDAFRFPPNVFDGFIRANEHKLATQVDILNNSNHDWYVKSQEAEALVQQLYQSNHEWYIKSEKAEALVQQLYQSNHEWYVKSQEAEALVQQLHQAKHKAVDVGLTARLTGLSLAVFRPPLKSAMRFVMARPALKQKLINWLNHKPALKSQLRHFAVQSGFVYDTLGAQVEGVTISFESLTPRAQKIALRLKRAHKKTKGRH